MSVVWRVTHTKIANDAKGILDCGGKRSATPLSHTLDGRKRRRRSALPAQSKTRVVNRTRLANYFLVASFADLA